MKIGTQSIPKRSTRSVTLVKQGGTVTLTIQALPFGFEEKLFDWLPIPRPIKKYARDHAGKALKGKDGTYVMEEDLSPEFLTIRRKRTSLQGVAMIHEALRADKTILWDTPEPQNGEPRDVFYEAISEEIRGANFTSGDIIVLVEAIRKLGDGKTADLEEAREGFSSEVS